MDERSNEDLHHIDSGDEDYHDAESGEENANPSPPPSIPQDLQLNWFDLDNEVLVIQNEELTGSDEAESSSSNQMNYHFLGRDGENASSSLAGASGKKQKVLTFDRSLPASHTYLGQDMELAGPGIRLYDSGAVIESVPMFPIPHMILMPGQQLPLATSHPRPISMFLRLIERNQQFGVISLRFREDASQQISGFGTLAQILSYKEESRHEITTLKMRAIGRQRFQLLDTQRLSAGDLSGKIRILPEILLSPALGYAELPSMLRRNTVKSKSPLKPRKFDRFSASAFTGWPKFVFKQYDLFLVIQQIKTELKRWYDPASVERLALRPSEFSFWVASNLPTDDDTKMHLCGMNCALQRLRCELSLLKRCTLLNCLRCGQNVGRNCDIFSMSIEGPMGAYVNPEGWVHETLTLGAAAVQSRGPSSTEFSWFPGYSWTVVECSRCGSHVGWMYKATKKSLSPQQFWGIIRTAIVPAIEEKDGENSADDLTEFMSM